MSNAVLTREVCSVSDAVRLEGNAAAERFLALLTSYGDTSLCWRRLPDRGESPLGKLDGSLSEVRAELDRAQAAHQGIFIVVNEGGHRGADIKRIRAVFIDSDSVSLSSVQWHVPPHFIAYRNDRHWHAYWLVYDHPCDRFTETQKRLAQYYRTDPSVSDKARVMRVPGFKHMKDLEQVEELVLLDCLHQLPGDDLFEAHYSYDVVTQGLPELPSTECDSPPNGKAEARPISFDEFREVLSFIDPTFADDYNQWVGMAKSIYHGQIPYTEEGIDNEALVDDWCSGKLWRERTRHTSFSVPSYKGKDHLLAELGPSARKRGPQIGLGTFIRLARESGYRPGPRLMEMCQSSLRHVGGSALSAPDENEKSDRPLHAHELAFGTYPPVEYLWDGLILKNHVNLLYGDGGTGKTLLSETLAVAVASGSPLFGHAVEEMPVLLVLCEDDYGETKSRLEKICAKLGVALESLPIHFWCRPGKDSALANIDDNGKVSALPFLEDLRRELEKIGPCFVVLDGVADLAVLDETKRQPVNAFCKRVLGELCQEYGVTLLVLAHPSKASMVDGTHYAGSTAWNNGVRQRLVLNSREGSDERQLQVVKSNYGSAVTLDLYLEDGVFTQTGSMDDQARQRREREAVLEVVVSLLDKGICVVRGNGSGQKPDDVAEEVKARYGISLTKQRVLKHLSKLERLGQLSYKPANNKIRGAYAGFRRGPRTEEEGSLSCDQEDAALPVARAS